VTSVVLGAAGFLGVNLVDALLARGEQPRCGRRARTNILPLKKKRVPLVQADLDKPAELVAAFAGASAVYHLAGHYPRYSQDLAAARAVGERQLMNVFDAAVAAGVHRVVYVSSTATVARRERGASTEADTFPRPPNLGTYHDLKWHMESVALAEARIDVAVACPSACLGPWDLRVGTSSLIVGSAHGLRPEHPDGVVSWVDARDVAEGLVMLASVPHPPRRLILSAGSTRLQHLLTELSWRYGVAPPSTPLNSEEAIAFADAEEARAAAGGTRPRLSREIADLIVHGVELDASLAHSLGCTFRPLDETLDAFDDWARRVRILPTPAVLESTA
jgi:dihydroflavonol-4-reductase